MEIRKDYLKNDTIIYAASRSNKPTNYRSDINIINKSNDFKSNCPFCPSNLKLVEDLIISDEKHGARIVKNRFPLVEGELGCHDVAIESFNHDIQLREMSSEFMFDFFKLILKRCEMILENEHIKNIQIFKNNGSLSGASLEHSHWQILSTSHIPKNILQIGKRYDEYFAKNNRCYLCNAEDEYVILQDEYTKVVLPKASVYSSTFRIYPKSHKGTFLELDDNEILSLCNMLIFVSNLLEKIEKGSSYNILFFAKPIGETNTNFHFFVEFVGRKGRLGGYELSTGEYMSSILPEDLYKEIKEILEV